MAAAGKRAGAAGQGRVVIEGVTPEIDCGRFPIKRVIGEEVNVEADIFIEGQESLTCVLLHRKRGSRRWTEVNMEPLVNDRWRASFTVSQLGRYQYTILGWPDPFKSWRRDLIQRLEAGQDVTVDLLIGADLVDAVMQTAPPSAATTLRRFAALLRGPDTVHARKAALDAELATLMAAHTSRNNAHRYQELEVVVDPVRARFSTWYEMFPRSAAREHDRHGTFLDVERWLPRLAEFGFDVLYLPPIHPIGETHRKGRNGALAVQPSDPGSPWAIGGSGGGHKAIHPQLGTFSDFQRLVEAARAHGIDIALDIAFQVAPDHPYVKEHVEWFRRRPDGSIQHAENPPKKYQDIYPFDFESQAAAELWDELGSIFTFWIDHGVRVFRVDNPHTKPFPFWEWVIARIKRRYPDVILLSEAFTRPKVMYQLTKLGFTQSYTYFAWRNTKSELMQYFRELTSPPVIDFFRANLWPNTPDILTEPFQIYGEPVFKTRLLLAATLGASYGIYGPPYETMENRAREAGSEEYRDSEKYELRNWDFSVPTAVSQLIRQVNRIRRENEALQSDRALQFHAVTNDQLLAYSKHTRDFTNVIITIVNLDPQHPQSGWLELSLAPLGLSADRPYHVRDLLSGAVFTWRGTRNFVQLDPDMPAHILRVQATEDSADG
jgi:starch synthase (maltosyl-transferring)